MAEEADIVTTPEAAISSLSGLGSENLHEFIRYGVASAIALLVDTLTLFVLTSVIGVPYLISGAIAFALGIIIVYTLSIKWVFAKRSLVDAKTEFAIFVVIGVIGLLINEAVLWILTGNVGLYYLFSKGASVILVFLWNFFARKFLLFRARS